MGASILQFYSSLVELLARCAPDAETIKSGRSDSVRARAILRSLVSMEDLEGVLGLRFILPVGKAETIINEDGEVEQVAAGERNGEGRRTEGEQVAAGEWRLGLSGTYGHQVRIQEF